MAAEIIENIETPAEETDQLPTDPQAVSQEELVQDLQGVDTTQPPSPEDDLPEKYRGKSIKEVVSMHQEAEKLIGKHSSEVGELRSVVDGFIKGQLQAQDNQPAPQEVTPEPVDFFEDPERAVSQAIEQHPVVKEARESAVENRRQASLAKLQNKHPDLEQVLSNPQFVEWVKGSPMRVEMFQRADQQFDFNAADELISTYKERTNVAQQAANVETEARKQAVKAASTGGAVSGANPSTGKRVYRRADIIKLMKNDPDRYEALSGEIMAAYAEGRVR